MVRVGTKTVMVSAQTSATAMVKAALARRMMRTTDMDPEDQEFMEMASAAAAMRRLFLAYQDAGFTEDQAIKLISILMAQASSNVLKDGQ